MKRMKKTKSDDKMSLSQIARMNIRAMDIYRRKYPSLFASCIAKIIWDTLTPYVGIYLSALIIGELASPSRDAERLKMLVLISLSAAAVISIVNIFLTRWKNSQTAGMWMKIEHIFADKMLEMDYSRIDDPKTAELHSTVMQNLNSSGWGMYHVWTSFGELVSSIFTVLGGVSLTVTLFTIPVPGQSFLNSPLAAIGIIVLMLAITAVSPIFAAKIGDQWAKLSKMHNFGNRLFGFFGFLGYNDKLALDVRTYRQDKICERFNTDKNSTFSSNGVFAKYARGAGGLYTAAASASTPLLVGMIYLFVCLKAFGGAFGLGAVTQYVASITKVSGGISEMVNALIDMRNNAPFLKLTFDYLDIPNDMYKGSLTVEKRSDRKYEIEFRNVSFKYPGSDNYSLKNVNMKFRVGERLAVVGMNGSGKTTFIKLLCRLYDPTEGEILLNGIDIRKYDYREYMDIFSVVFQDFNLLSMNLSENIASGSDFDKDRVIDCLTKAGFSDRLATMPDGIDTCLYKSWNKNGVDVSGGEAQKLAIARALYKDAPFIILDEPTAALDPIAEAEIYEKFDSIAGDKTAIYISHRLSSCKFCDEIAVFHEGSVIQQGGHEDLLADKDGKYSELWNAQAQYYVKEGGAA